jgi:hypothetical protein
LRQRVSARLSNPRAVRRGGGGGDGCCQTGRDGEADPAAGQCNPPGAVRCRPVKRIGGGRCR